jgi:hypothetical protein
MRQRVLVTGAATAAAAVGVMLLLLREERHLVRHALPAAVLTGLVAAVVTWRGSAGLR